MRHDRTSSYRPKVDFSLGRMAEIHARLLAPRRQQPLAIED